MGSSREREARNAARLADDELAETIPEAVERPPRPADHYRLHTIFEIIGERGRDGTLTAEMLRQSMREAVLAAGDEEDTRRFVTILRDFVEDELGERG